MIPAVQCYSNNKNATRVVLPINAGHHSTLLVRATILRNGICETLHETAISPSRQNLYY